MGTTAVSVDTVRRRLDRIALDQLRAETARLAAENDDLRDRLATAEENADFWSREATEQHLQLCEQLGGSPGMTVDGALVVVPTEVRT
jgi:regulator of replication initiation timing